MIAVAIVAVATFIAFAIGADDAAAQSVDAGGDAGSSVPPLCDNFGVRAPSGTEWFFFYITLKQRRLHVDKDTIRGYLLVVADALNPSTVAAVGGDRVQAWGGRDHECVAVALPTTFADSVSVLISLPISQGPHSHYTPGLPKAIARKSHQSADVAAEYVMVVPMQVAALVKVSTGVWDLAEQSAADTRVALEKFVVDKVQSDPRPEVFESAVTGATALTGVRKEWLIYQFASSGYVAPESVRSVVSAALVGDGALVQAEKTRAALAGSVHSVEAKLFLESPSASAEVPIPKLASDLRSEKRPFIDVPVQASDDTCAVHKIRSERAHATCIEACSAAQGSGPSGNGCRDACNGMKDQVKNTACWRRRD